MFGFRLLGLGGGAGKAVIDATGGTITTSGDYKIHVFTGSGTFAVSNGGNAAGSNTVEYLVVAGGGAGGGVTQGNYSGGGGGVNQKTIQPIITPIQATKPVDTNLIQPKDNFFNFVAYKVGGLSGGVSYGPPPKKGPNSQVPPVKMKKGGLK